MIQVLLSIFPTFQSALSITSLDFCRQLVLGNKHGSPGCLHTLKSLGETLLLCHKHIEHVKGEVFILSVWLQGDEVSTAQI